ncbi:uncharacterized protein [Paramisgurnus dabryanus]|uniref:uncharacterized protein n=1 Tax=Paramisgurnus dabryanus TaxID=90735 RepID=UPI0031F4198A
MFCRCLPVVCILLMCLVFESHSSPRGQRGSPTFSNSLRLTRAIRTHVQKLLNRYKEQMFGDELFENRELTLSSLPAVTVSYNNWIQMQDTERLQLASHHLQTFWIHLEDQRQQLEKEKDGNRKEPRRDKRGRPQFTLFQSFMALQIDLRDLMRQVNSQLESLTAKQNSDSTSTKSPQPSPLSSTSTSSPIPSTHRSTASTTLQTSSHTDAPQSSTHFTVKSTETSTATNTKPSAKTEETFVGVTVNPKKPTQTSTVHHSRGSQQKTEALSSGTSRWVQHLKGYVILRDLERYLSRLARDYTILRAKH